MYSRVWGEGSGVCNVTASQQKRTTNWKLSTTFNHIGTQLCILVDVFG